MKTEYLLLVNKLFKMYTKEAIFLFCKYFRLTEHALFFLVKSYI